MTITRTCLVRAAAYLAVLSLVLTPTVAFSQDDIDYSEMSLEDLLNVEVTTAGKKAQKINEIPASVVVITRAEIEKYGYKTLEEVLSNVAGLYGINVGNPTGKKFGVRGFWSSTANNIILLINGMRQERIAADGAVYMANRIPPEAIDRVEVIRGPMSVLYGTGAFFGVINVITNTTDGEKDSLASVTYGADETAAVFGRTTFESDNVRTVLNFGYRETDGIDEPYSRMSTYDLASDYGITSDSTGGRWGERNNFFNLSTKVGNFYADVNYDFNKMEGDVFFPAVNRAVAKRSYLGLVVGYEKEVSEKFSYDAKVTYHKGDVDTDWDWFTEPGEIDTSGDLNYREDMEVDLTGFFNPSDRVSVTAGLYYKKIFHEQLFTVAPLIDFVFTLGLSEPAVSKAAFVQADFTATEKLQFVVGLRGDQAEKYETYYRIFADGAVTARGEYTADDIETLPRFAAIFKASETNIFKFLYGKAINHPNIPQNAAQAISPVAVTLEPEFIETFELNHLWAGSSKFSTNISIFQNTLDKLIINDLQVVDGNFVNFNRNAGEIETVGAEFRLQVVPNDKLDFELSAIFQDSEDKRAGFSDITIPYSPETLGYIKIHYDFNEHSGIGITGQYVSEMETIYDQTTESRIAPTADSYFNLDLSARIGNLFGGDYYLQLLATNVTDEEYLHPTVPLQLSWADKGIVGAGTAWQVTLGKKFSRR